jgi:HSP20 family protein
MFEDLFEGLEDRLPEFYGEGRFVPAIDVTEDEDNVVLTAEVPGMTKEDLDVTVDNGVLTLRGEKKEESEDKGKDYHRVERRYGRFERRIRLPQYVNAEAIGASYQDGILKLTMPKAEAAKTRSIQIK